MKTEMSWIRQMTGNNIREGRKRLGVTQERFAEEIGISTQSLSALENGAQFARMDTYCKIAESLSIPLSMLFCFQRPQDEVLDDQIILLLTDFSIEEKMALYNVLKAVRTLVRMARPF